MPKLFRAHDLYKSCILSYSYKSTEKSDGIYVLELEEKKKNVYEQENDYDPYEHRVVEHPTK